MLKVSLADTRFLTMAEDKALAVPPDGNAARDSVPDNKGPVKEEGIEKKGGWSHDLPPFLITHQ